MLAPRRGGFSSSCYQYGLFKAVAFTTSLSPLCLYPLPLRSFSSVPNTQHNHHEDHFSYAETSAEGAARYLRLCLPSPPQKRLFTTSTPSSTSMPGARKGKNKLSSILAPFHIERKPQHQPASFGETVSADLSAVLQWRTPQEMLSHGERSSCGLTGDVSSSLTWPDEEIIRRSHQTAVWSMAYDFAKSIVQELAGSTPSEELRLESANLLEDIMDTVVKASSAIHYEQDRFACQTAAAALLQAQLCLQHRISEVILNLDRVQLSLQPLPLPLYHRIIAMAGKQHEYGIIQQLTHHATQAWDGRTDAWILYAQIRASIGLNKRVAALKKYLSMYQNAKMAPKEAYTCMDQRDELQKQSIRPPRYLFIFLLHHQTSKSSNRLSSPARPGLKPSRAIEIIRAMRAAGHEVEGDVWWTLMSSSPNLAHPLSQLFRISHGDVRNIMKSSDHLLLNLLRQRAERLAVRDVIRISQHLGLNIRILRRRHSQGMLQLPETTVSAAVPSFLSTSKQAQVYALIAEMFGRLGHPERAFAMMKFIQKLPMNEVSEDSFDRAWIGTMRGHNVQGEPKKSIALGLDILGEKVSKPLWDGPKRSRLSAPVLSALIRSAALLPSYEDKITAVKSLMSLCNKYNLPPNPDICRGLASLLFAAVGTDERDIDGMWVLLRELRQIGHLPKGEFDEFIAPPQRRMRFFLNILGELGLEDRIFSVARRRIIWEDRRIRRAERRGYENQRAEKIHREDLQSKLTHSSIASSPRANEDVTEARARKSPRSGLVSSAASGLTTTHSAANLRPTSGVAAVHLNETAKARSPSADLKMTFSSSVRRSNLFEDDDRDIAPALQREMRKPLSVSAYAMRLRVYSVFRGDHRSAAYILQSMMAHNVRPTVFHISPVIEGLAADGQIDAARGIAASCYERFGHLPTARVQAVIARALIRVGRDEEAKQYILDWAAQGGVIDDFIRSQFRRVPALADPGHARATFSRAAQSLQEGGSAVATLAEVDEAYMHLWRNYKYCSSQKLAVMALQSGIRPDWEFKRRISVAGNRLRKLQTRRGVTPKVISTEEMRCDPRAMLRLDSFFIEASMREHEGNEQSMPAIIDAYELNCIARHLALDVIEPIQRQEAEERLQFRHEVKRIILDLVHGVWGAPLSSKSVYQPGKESQGPCFQALPSLRRVVESATESSSVRASGHEVREEHALSGESTRDIQPDASTDTDDTASDPYASQVPTPDSIKKAAHVVEPVKVADISEGTLEYLQRWMPRNASASSSGEGDASPVNQNASLPASPLSPPRYTQSPTPDDDRRAQILRTPVSNSSSS